MILLVVFGMSSGYTNHSRVLEMWSLGILFFDWFLRGDIGAQITAGTDDGSGGAQNVGYTEGGLAKMEGLPYAFGRFGYVGATRFYDLAGHGYYWSGSTVSSANSFYLGYNGSELYPANQSGRVNGRSVRCVAR